MPAITLLCGNIVLVDDSDAHLLESKRWKCAQRGKSTRKSRPVYVVMMENGKEVLLHRLVMGASKGQIVDHKNGDTLDNRRENLRFATNAENIRNSRKRVYDGVASRFKGVGFDVKRHKWRATITDNYKTRHLGYFDSEAWAAFAYDMASLASHGEFGRRNFLPLC